MTGDQSSLVESVEKITCPRYRDSDMALRLRAPKLISDCDVIGGELRYSDRLCAPRYDFTHFSYLTSGVLFPSLPRCNECSSSRPRHHEWNWAAEDFTRFSWVQAARNQHTLLLYNFIISFLKDEIYFSPQTSHELYYNAILLILLNDTMPFSQYINASLCLLSD